MTITAVKTAEPGESGEAGNYRITEGVASWRSKQLNPVHQIKHSGSSTTEQLLENDAGSQLHSLKHNFHLDFNIENNTIDVLE